MASTLLFWMFATVLVAAAARVVTANNPVHSVLFLIFAFFNAAGLFLLAGAEFLAMILVVVYVGAVAVLFLFVVMMLDITVVQMREGLQRYAPVGAALALALVAELAATLGAFREVGASVPLRAAPTPTALSNTAALGTLLYTHDVLLFQLAGLILLVAMIGAIVLTHREKSDVRRQNIARQVNRTVAQTLVLTRPASGQGIAALGIFRPEDAPPPPALPLVDAREDAP